MATRRARAPRRAGALVGLGGLIALVGPGAPSAAAQPLAVPAPQDPYAPALAPPGAVAPAVVEQPPAPRPFARVQVAIRAGLGITALDQRASRSELQLRDYGWDGVGSPTMPTLGAEAQYLLAPLVDVGATLTWARGVHAKGLGGDPDHVTTTATRLGLVARLHYARGKPFIPEPRIDLGVERRTIELHDVADADHLLYLRVGFDWRAGNRRAGVQVSGGYTLTDRAAAGRLDPATGGLDLGFGPYVRF